MVNKYKPKDFIFEPQRIYNNSCTLLYLVSAHSAEGDKVNNLQNEHQSWSQ